ncbi:diacylglycerol kinase family lipid kinase [Neobacillus piezotolerans]|uniref:Diacylglycerol kinase family lipid kinase n=1 Tax=Neobacillus piezotolerans TaxID=2259171 RepID=A0A3D8GKR4_9BACI|nr:YegS/Rv2252/BmrU family lipid kinase [Neobacillus piezotolerans]RDU34849.1 diacylglycerol kinase family lipid kinase [Neobacillus piezotolerans]
MATFKRAVLIYNGNAGQKSIRKALGECIPILSPGIEELLLLKTERPGHAQELCSKYGEWADLAIILGGDGTVHEGINGLCPLEKRPLLAILPGGTCNDFARTLGIPQDIQKAAEAILSGTPIPIDAMEINGQYALNFLGIGLVAEASNNIKGSEKALLGKVSYYLSAMRTMREMEPFRYTIDCDGERFAGEAVMVLAANGRYIGTNELPFQNIEIDDGKANIFIIKNTSLALVKEILATDVTLPDGGPANELLHCSGRKIAIHTAGAMDADTDGEVYLETPVLINVLKHHLFAIAP